MENYNSTPPSGMGILIHISEDMNPQQRSKVLNGDASRKTSEEPIIMRHNSPNSLGTTEEDSHISLSG